MLLCDVIFETIRGLIFLPALWPCASEEDVEMMPDMIEHTVLGYMYKKKFQWVMEN